MKKTKTFVIAIITILFLQAFTMPNVAEAASKMPKGTTIAGISVAGQTDEEIKATLETEIAIWQSGEDIYLRSEFENFRVPKTIVEFDLDETLKVLKKKTKRELSTFFLKPKNVNVPLVAMVNKADETYQTLSAIDYIELDESLVQIVEISTRLESGEAPLSYVAGKEMQLEKVAEVELPVEELSDAVLKQLVSTLDDYTVEPNSPFIFSETIEIHNNLKKSPDELSFVASALYTAFLQSDFTIVERHSQLSVPKYTKSGTDALVNLKLKKDLIVLNESEFSYKISMHQKDGKLYTKLETFPNDFTYKFKRENKKKIKPRTLYRYDLALKPGQQKEVEEGKDGQAIEVHREKYDAGNLVSSEVISVDVYLPQSKIVAVSTAEKISKDGEQLIGSENIKPPEDLIVNNGKDAVNVKPNIPTSSPGHYVYTKDEAEKLIADLAAVGDKLNKEILEGMDEKVQEMEREFEKELKRLEAERDKLIDALDRIESESGDLEEEEFAFDDFLMAFEETLAEFDELAEDEGFKAYIHHQKEGMRLVEQGDFDKAEVEFNKAIDIQTNLFANGKNTDFLEALKVNYEKRLNGLVSSLSVNSPLVASKQIQDNTLDFERLDNLEVQAATISEDLKKLKKDIKDITDKDEIKVLEKLAAQKEDELDEIQVDIDDVIVTIYSRILNAEAAVNEEMTNTLNTLNQIQEAYEDAKESLGIVKADRNQYPSLVEKDYRKLIDRLIKFSKTDKQADREAYDRRLNRIEKTLLEISSNFNNNSGTYFLDAIELSASQSSYDVTFGRSNGLQYYPYFPNDNLNEKNTTQLSDYQIISRDILSHVYQSSR